MLRRRLLLFGALIIVPVAALLFYGVYQQRQEALTAARDGVVRTTRLVSERHRRLLDRTQQLLSVLVNLPQVRQGDWAATNAIFANVVRTVREYPNLRVSDLSGSMVASAFPNAPAGSNRGRDWFEQIIRTSGYAMSGYFLGQTMSGRPEVVMGAPVLDDRGRVRYVLSVTIDVFQFSNVSADELPERSIVNVVGRDGIVLARHPDPQNGIGRQLNPRALMDVMRSGPAEGVLESDGLDGTPRVVGYVTLPVAPASPGVYLLIGVPRDRILAPINRALFINMGGLVLVTVLMLGLGAVGSRILVLAPVDRLLEVTRRIAGGDLSERADDALRRDADEFGQLARGLDDMTARLRERAAERKEAEQRLQESEARYRRIVETATEGIWTLDAAGRTTFVNEAMAAMLGYSPDEMLGMSFLNFMDESVRAEALAAFARREAGVSEQLDFRFRHKSGRDVWTSLSTGPIADDAGRFAGALAMATDITEARAAAGALGAVESRLAVVLEHVTDGFFTMDREWRYTGINPAGARMLGKTVEDLVGRRCLDAFPEAVGTPWAGTYRQVMDTGEAATAEEYYEPLDTWFEASVFPFAGGISVFFRDITIRKRAERAVQDSETRLRSTVDVLRRSQDALQKAQQIAHLGNWEWDIPTGALAWSDEIYRIFGGEPQSFTPVYDAFLGMIHPDDRQAVVGAVNAALAGERRYDVEHRIVRPDGSQRVVHQQAEVYRDQRQQAVRMVGTVLDITERNRAEEALRQTQIQLRHLLDSSPVAIYSLQAVPALRTTFVSENVTSFLGYEPHEFIDDAGLWRDRLHPDDVHRTLPDLARVLEHGVARLLYRFRHKDGHYVWVRDESKLVHDADGHPLEIVGVLEDVTGKVELGEQLRQAQKMEAVGQLAGGIAHDFNNLLQVISGHTEMLLGMADDTGALHARARTIRAATDRGATLTRRLLAFSRRQVLEPRVLDLNQLVAEVKAMMGPVIGEDLVLETQLAPDLPPVSIDPNQFEQALMNLLMNARDAMSGGGVVTIATAMVELVADNAHRPFDVPAGRYVAVSVRDRGPGIDDEALPHLFEPFFSTKPTGKGTGLGLASVYGVLSQSGGYVTVSSERGRGATFTALLPPAQQTVTPAHVAGAEPDAQAGRGTILVVEDEDDVRAIIRTYLESSGYVVREAASSDEALASVDSGPIALLVSDVVMPGMGGAELVSRLSARQPGLKVLLVSGNPDGDAVIDRLVQPGTAFLQKPFSRQNLIAKVHELLGEHT